MSGSQQRTVIFIGAPGSGKTSQATALSKALQAKTISPGQMLRDLKGESVIGTYMQHFFLRDTLADIAWELIEKEIKRAEKNHSNLILEGTPRAPADAYILQEKLSKYNLAQNVSVLVLDISVDVVAKRLANAPRAGRESEDMGARHKQFEKETAPLLQVLKDQGLSAVHIDASASQEEVTERILKALDANKGVKWETKENKSSNKKDGEIKDEDLKQVAQKCGAIENAECVMRLLSHLDLTPKKKNEAPRFPGSQCNGLQQHHLDSRHKERVDFSRYKITPKADGTRYLVLVIHSAKSDRVQIRIMDRNLHAYSCFAAAAATEGKGEGEEAEENGPGDSVNEVSVLDAELVRAKDNHLMLLTFDCLCARNKSLINQPLEKRLENAQMLVDLIAKNGYTSSSSSFSGGNGESKQVVDVVLKHYEDGNGMSEENFDKLMNSENNFSFSSDGLILTPKGNYRIGFDTTLLKWKPSQEFTADFRARKYNGSNSSVSDPNNAEEKCVILELFVGQGGVGDVSYASNGNFGCLIVNEKLAQEINEKVVELAWDAQRSTLVPSGKLNKTVKGGWVFKRMRTDKPRPNIISVVNSIVEAIRHPEQMVTLEALKQAILKNSKVQSDGASRGRENDSSRSTRELDDRDSNDARGSFRGGYQSREGDEEHPDRGNDKGGDVRNESGERSYRENDSRFDGRERGGGFRGGRDNGRESGGGRGGFRGGDRDGDRESDRGGFRGGERDGERGGFRGGDRDNRGGFRGGFRGDRDRERGGFRSEGGERGGFRGGRGGGGFRDNDRGSRFEGERGGYRGGREGEESGSSRGASRDSEPARSDRGGWRDASIGNDAERSSTRDGERGGYRSSYRDNERGDRNFDRNDRDEGRGGRGGYRGGGGGGYRDRAEGGGGFRGDRAEGRGGYDNRDSRGGRSDRRVSDRRSSVDAQEPQTSDREVENQDDHKEQQEQINIKSTGSSEAKSMKEDQIAKEEHSDAEENAEPDVPRKDNNEEVSHNKTDDKQGTDSAGLERRGSVGRRDDDEGNRRFDSRGGRDDRRGGRGGRGGFDDRRGRGGGEGDSRRGGDDRRGGGDDRRGGDDRSSNDRRDGGGDERRGGDDRRGAGDRRGSERGFDDRRRDDRGPARDSNRDQDREPRSQAPPSRADLGAWRTEKPAETRPRDTRQERDTRRGDRGAPRDYDKPRSERGERDNNARERRDRTERRNDRQKETSERKDTNVTKTHVTPKKEIAPAGSKDDNMMSVLAMNSDSEQEEEPTGPEVETNENAEAKESTQKEESGETDRKKEDTNARLNDSKRANANAESEAKSDSYYAGVSRKESAVEPLLNWHNAIKRDLYNRHLFKDSTVVELAGGRGGDLWKLMSRKPREILLVDIDQDALDEAKNRWDTKNGKDKSLHSILRLQQSDLRKPAEFTTTSGALFDFGACHFALHYFFQSSEAWESFAKTLNSSVKPGGLFVTTVFDGEKVESLLKKSSDGSVVFCNGALSLSYSNKNSAGDVDQPVTMHLSQTDDAVFGRSVTVKVDTIGTHVEYLVKIPELVLRMNAQGWDVVESESFEKCLDSGSFARAVGLTPISNSQMRAFSALNTALVFRRKAHK